MKIKNYCKCECSLVDACIAIKWRCSESIGHENWSRLALEDRQQIKAIVRIYKKMGKLKEITIVETKEYISANEGLTRKGILWTDYIGIL
jgi:hypothetical protein